MAIPTVGKVRDQQVKPRVRWALGHALPRTVMRRSAGRGDLHARMIDQATRSAGTDRSLPDDRPLLDLFEEARASGPLHRARFAYVAVTQEAVKDLLTSNDFRSGVETTGDGPIARAFAWSVEPGVLGPLSPPSLLVTDPPDHTRYRKLVTRVFSVRAVERLRERTQEIADGLLDRLEAERDRGVPLVDLVGAYCAELPVTVIAEILGVPEQDRQRVLDFGSAAAPSLDFGLPWDVFCSVESALADFDAWLTDHLERLRREPGEDLMSKLVAVRDEDGGLDHAELKATAGLVLAAGFETTVNLLGNGIVLLDRHPDQLERLRREPDLWPTAVDEVLRLDPPVLLTGRTATRDTQVAGVPVGEGRIVSAVLGAANRDPLVFEDPATFDVSRENAREHVAFSAGRHYCLGAALARMEGEVGLRSLFERFPDLRVLPGARRRETRILRGWADLPVDLG